jgi:Tfp pilus assembly protein PilF
LHYIEKGKQMFEDNMGIIGSELEIYFARKQTDVLKEKLKAAIEVDDRNELLHVSLANIYRRTKQFEEAEKEYLKAIELKSDSEPANYNLGVLYYDAGKEWNEKLAKLPMKDPKEKEYEAKSNDYFRKGFTYLEAAYEIGKDAGLKKVLRQLALRLGEKEKAEKYK